MLREKLVGKTDEKASTVPGKVAGALGLDMQIKEGSNITAPSF
jgi:hypothetical protein